MSDWYGRRPDRARLADPGWRESPRAMRLWAWAIIVFSAILMYSVFVD